MRNVRALAWIAVPLVAGCVTPQRRSERWAADAAPAADALRRSRFEEAEQKAREIVARDGQNSVARAVAAVALYRRTMHDFATDAVSIGASALLTGVNTRYLTFSLDNLEKALAQVDADLAVAAEDRFFRLDLCLACWEVDWDRDGRVDQQDRQLLEVEYDAQGRKIDRDDPRRRPTFRFDHGDLLWARAMVSFQRAAAGLVGAYDWSGLGTGLGRMALGRLLGADAEIRIKLVDAARVHRARTLILDGLKYADGSRLAYLAETDDEREWVPSPTQKSHPLPLPVDAALYETWAGVVGDVRRLVDGAEGLPVAALAQLGDHRWRDPPGGYLDLGTMLDKPGDLVLTGRVLETLGERSSREQVEGSVRDALGNGYREQMKPSPLVERLARMKTEIDRGQESAERKLRYLLWLN